MVVTETMINKETKKPYVSEDGKELKVNKLEVGDEFIPKYSSPKKDESGEYPNYSLVAKVRNEETKEKVKIDGEDEIYVQLTPTQYEYLVKKAEEGVEINQTVFNTHEYESHNKKCVGIHIKGDYKESITFEEADSQAEEPKEE